MVRGVFLSAMIVVLVCSAARAEVLTVPSDGSTVVSQPLASGVTYRIEASGTYRYGPFEEGELTNSADAAFNYHGEDGWLEGWDWYPHHLQLWMNGNPLDWLGALDGRNFTPHTFSTNHVYRTYITGAGQALSFRIEDDIYNDNVGSLTVNIRAEPVTNSAPVVSNVTAWQRTDGTFKVEIRYDLADADNDACTVWAMIMGGGGGGGATWTVPASAFTGDFGNGITPGTGKAIVWDVRADVPNPPGNDVLAGQFKVRVWADDGQGPTLLCLVPAGSFPYQGDPNQTIFVNTFLIDKYEITNQFYCQFLNNGNGDHWEPFMSDEIERLGEPSSYYYRVVSGRESYPARYINKYDAEDFAAWRSALEGVTYRLPTEQEWEKAAAWDPVQSRYYTYAYQSDEINMYWCNYGFLYGDPPGEWPGEFTPVGYFNGSGSHFGGADPRHNAASYYGCYDMTGNVWERTSDPTGICRGGAQAEVADTCRCVFRLTPDKVPYDLRLERGTGFGIRLVLSTE